MKKTETTTEKLNREIDGMPILLKIFIAIVAIAVMIIVNINMLS